MNKVSEKIIADAEKSAAEIIRNREIEVQEILRRQTVEIQTISVKNKQKLEKIHLHETDKLNSINDIEKKKNILRAKRDIISSLKEKLYRLIADDDSLYRSFIKHTITRGILTGNEEIIAPEEELNIFTSDFIEELNALTYKKTGQQTTLRLSPQKQPHGRGFILRDGKISYNALLEGIIRDAMEKYETEIVEILNKAWEGESDESS